MWVSSEGMSTRFIQNHQGAAYWSNGMILALGASGSGFDSRVSPRIFSTLDFFLFLILSLLITRRQKTDLSTCLPLDQSVFETSSMRSSSLRYVGEGLSQQNDSCSEGETAPASSSEVDSRHRRKIGGASLSETRSRGRLRGATQSLHPNDKTRTYRKNHAARRPLTVGNKGRTKIRAICSISRLLPRLPIQQNTGRCESEKHSFSHNDN